MDRTDDEKTEPLLQLVQRMDELEGRLSRLELAAEFHHPQAATIEPETPKSAEPVFPTELDTEHARAQPRVLDSARDTHPTAEWGEEPTPDYFWVVVCKNHRFHRAKSTLYRYGHRIQLGETDSYSSPPTLPDRIKVRCDSCGKEYWYARNEVLRAEFQVTESFRPHPLFPPPE